MAAVPARLPRDFRWLWTAYGASNLADGILLAVGPLLVTRVTLDPFAVAAAVFLQRLPWLFLGLLAGAVVDRVDRRRLAIAMHLVRAAVLGALAAGIVAGALSLPLLYACFFLLGTAETFADNAGSTLVAAVVPKADLGAASSRLVGTNLVTNQLAGPPLGALLFGLGLAVPITTEALLLVLAAACTQRIGRPTAVATPRAPGVGLLDEIVAGARWLRASGPVWRLFTLVVLFNLTFGAVYPLWVLYAFERLGLDDVGFGLLLSASAVGGVVGSWLFSRLEQRFTYGQLMRVGLSIEACTHLVMALTTSWAVAGAVLVLFGAHAAVWGSIASTIRLRATPDELLGRINSVYFLGGLGSIAIGTLVGGALAEQFGVLAPFWLAFVGASLTVAWVWPRMDQIGAAGDPVPHA